MFEGKNILVTGGTGMIGIPLVKKLLEKGAKVSVSSLDFDQRRKVDGVEYYNRNLVNFHECILSCREMDYVFHLAGIKGSPKMCAEQPADFMVPLLQMNTNMMEAARREGVKKYLFTSSVGVYHPDAILREDDVWKTFPSENDKFAGWAKRMGELQAEAYKIQYEWDDIYIVRPANCFSEDTDVLTPDGIKNIKDFKIGDKIYTLNKETFEVEEDEIIDTIISETNEFINIKGQSIDWKVTKDHNMFLNTNNNDYKFIKAEKIINYKSQLNLAEHKIINNKIIDKDVFNLWEWVDENHTLGLIQNNKFERKLSEFKRVNGTKFHRIAKKSDFKNINIYDYINENDLEIFVKDFEKNSNYNPIFIPIKSFIEFLGWYIAEGNISNFQSAQIVVTQLKKKYRKEIENCINEMGFNARVSKKNITFTARVIRNMLKHYNLVGCENKNIPKFIFNLSYNLRKSFFDSLMKGDGNKDGKKYTTKSKKLAEDMFHLAFTLGYQPLLRKYKREDVYRVLFKVRNQKRTIKRENREIVFTNKKEKVYCVTAKKNHIIFAGRNGFMGWIGQCYGPFDNFDINNSMVIPSMINKAINNKIIDLMDDGQATRDFIYADDVADGMLHVFEKGYPQPVNLGSGIGHTIYTIANIISGITGAKVAYGASKTFGDAVRLMDVSRAKNLGFQATTLIEEGLKKTIEWYLENKDITRYNVFKDRK